MRKENSSASDSYSSFSSDYSMEDAVESLCEYSDGDETKRDHELANIDPAVDIALKRNIDYTCKFFKMIVKIGYERANL